MQKETADALTAIGTILAAVATTFTVLVAVMVFRGQRLLSRRQLLIPLWEYMADVRNIDLDDPAPAQVRSTANTLELVAISVEGRMVDSAVIERTFGAVFISLYDQIRGIDKIPGMRQDDQPLSGTAFLSRYPASNEYYRKLIDKRDGQNRVK
jgi:hypothetical protein